MRFIGIIIAGAILVAVAGGVFLWGEERMGDSLVSLTAPNGAILVEVADTDPARRRGLSDRETICPERGCEGMLFVFDESDRHGIWMKDMYFSIDIVWMNEEKTVVDVVQNVSPDTYPQAFRPREPARYVLELTAGTAEVLGIEPGVSLQFSL